MFLPWPDLPLRRNCLLTCFTSGAWELRWETFMPEPRAQLLAVVGEQLRIVSAARDGNIGHAIVEQVFHSHLGIDVDQHAIPRMLLAGITCDRIANGGIWTGRT